MLHTEEMHLVAGDGLAFQDCDQMRVNALSDTEFCYWIWVRLSIIGTSIKLSIIFTIIWL